MKNSIHLLTLCSLLLLVACKPAPEVKGCAAVSIGDGWVRQAPPGAQVMAGYLQLGNRSADPIRVTGASSDAFKAIEFHETQHRGSSMSMQRLDALAVPANGELQLAPSGKHLMLFNPVADLSVGQSLTIEFQCDDGQRLSHEFEVRAFSHENGGASHGHHQEQQ